MKKELRLRWYNIILRTIVVLFVVGVGILYALGEYFRATVGLVSIVGIFLPSFLYNHIFWFQRYFNRSFLRTIEIVTVVSILLNAFGSLGLYRLRLEYDGVLHFSVTGFIAFFVMILVGIVLSSRNDKDYAIKAIAYGIISTILVVVVLWEFYEYSADQVLGTGLSTDLAQPGVDTYVDIIWDFVGISVAWLFAYYNLKEFIKKYKA